MKGRLPSLPGVVAVLAVHRAITARGKGYARSLTAGGAGGVIHRAGFACVAIGITRLGVFSNQERIKGIRTHIHAYQIAISALPISLPTGRANARMGEAPLGAKLALGVCVLKRVFTLFAD